MKGDSGMSYRSVLNLIRNAINCGWSHDDRHAIVQEMWSEIRELCVNLLDDAALIGINNDEKKQSNLNVKFVSL